MKLKDAVAAVLKLDDLSPCLETNQTFSQLVAVVVAASEDELAEISEETRAQVREICAAAEGELEKYWAMRLVAAPDAATELQQFPYRNNYKELVGREVALVEQAGTALAGKRTLIVGSGPLPMTSLELHAQRGMKVDHVDISADAIELCRQVSTALNLECEHYTADGQKVQLKSDYELILIAALAGETTDSKQAIINNLLPYLADNGRLLLRSAWGARQLLYPVVAAQELKNVQLMEEYHPTDEVINSILIVRASTPLSHPPAHTSVAANDFSSLDVTTVTPPSEKISLAHAGARWQVAKRVETLNKKEEL